MVKPDFSAKEISSRKSFAKLCHSLFSVILLNDMGCASLPLSHLFSPPTLLVKYWRGYQLAFFRRLLGQEVVLAGDGRHYSILLYYWVYNPSCTGTGNDFRNMIAYLN